MEILDQGHVSECVTAQGLALVFQGSLELDLSKMHIPGVLLNLILSTTVTLLN